MEFRIERSALVDAVAWAAKSLPARSPVPVLGGLLLDATDGRLGISGFDYEASAHIEVTAETVTAGRALVLGRRLLDICRVLPDATVACALTGSRFVIEGGGTRFGLSTLPLHEYPSLPDLPAFCGTVDASEFATAVAQVATAAGRDDALPVLTGIQLRLDGEALTLAASDRYRYAVRTLTWKPETAAAADAAAVPEVNEVVVPGRRLAEISRSLGKSGLVRIGLGGSATGSGGGLIAFEADGMRTTLRLLEGRLPRYEKLFALDGTAVAVTAREPLAEAVRRVSVVAEPNSPIQLTFSPEGSVLLQAGYEDDVASQQVPATLTGAAEEQDAADVVVAFNPAFLLEALNSFTASQVRFALLGPGQRALLSGVPNPKPDPDPDVNSDLKSDVSVDTEGDDGADATGAVLEEHRHLLMAVRQLS